MRPHHSKLLLFLGKYFLLRLHRRLACLLLLRLVLLLLLKVLLLHLLLLLKVLLLLHLLLLSLPLLLLLPLPLLLVRISILILHLESSCVVGRYGGRRVGARADKRADEGLPVSVGVCRCRVPPRCSRACARRLRGGLARQKRMREVVKWKVDGVKG